MVGKAISNDPDSSKEKDAMEKRIAAIVVTYNRIQMLKENILALLSQTHSCDIIVVDNASTDGTNAFFNAFQDSRVHYFNTGKNVGGSGGFAYGVSIAEEQGYDYFWIMDDDSIPEQDALESMVNKANLLNDEFSFIASLVYWTDGSLCEMNLPGLRYKGAGDAKLDLIDKYHIIPIETGSFVGCFVNSKVSRQAGLPIADFFIYGDDNEYTKRLRRYLPAYLDLDSHVVHKAPTNRGGYIAEVSEDRIGRFFFQARNGVYIEKKNGFVALLKKMKNVAIQTRDILLTAKTAKGKRLLTLYRGFFAGFFFNPEIMNTREQVENWINGQ